MADELPFACIPVPGRNGAAEIHPRAATRLRAGDRLHFGHQACRDERQNCPYVLPEGNDVPDGRSGTRYLWGLCGHRHQELTGEHAAQL